MLSSSGTCCTLTTHICIVNGLTSAYVGLADYSVVCHQQGMCCGQYCAMSLIIVPMQTMLSSTTLQRQTNINDLRP